MSEHWVKTFAKFKMSLVWHKGGNECFTFDLDEKVSLQPYISGDYL